MKKKLFSIFLKGFLVTGMSLINEGFTTDRENAAAQNNINLNESLCFLIKEGDHFHKREGDNFDVQSPPYCSFNICFAAIAINEGKVINEAEPVLAYKDGYEATRDILKQDHNPRSWMQNSCLWYTQLLVEDMGKDRIARYLKEFNYGNQDLLHYKIADQLPRFWLSSSLKISPLEHLNFLEDLMNSKFQFLGEEVLDLIRKIIWIEELVPGWDLYGKGGAGNKRHLDGREDENGKYGWFIGWLQERKQAGRKIFFVRYRNEYLPGLLYPSIIAREEVKEELKRLLEREQ
ncbi:MAG: hypothetical protein K0M45_07255 [Candidatus Paracaedibacteraceae bacterium]|nr:hypothetical protein [Candidatus Paracaedibacteraceae bacterium]